MLSNRIHGSILPQICPVVKVILGNLHGVSLIGFDLADRTTAALFDKRRSRTHAALPLRVRGNDLSLP